jgi:hypothetical protein
MPKNSKSAPSPLTAPLVSDKELDKARKLLKDQLEAKKARSSMVHWLNANGKKDSYDSSPLHERRQFMVAWTANHMLAKETKSSLTSKRTISTQQELNSGFQWMGLEKMTIQLGEHKAKNKIAHGNLDHQPDPDTGKDHVVYNIWRTVVSLLI